MRSPIIVATVLFAGCDRAPAVVDAAVIDASPIAICTDLQDLYEQIVLGLDDECEGPADCALAGGVSSCDCEPFLGPSCWGHPVSRAALEEVSGQLSEIAADFWELCGDFTDFEIEAVCDCEPWATVTCETGRCGREIGEWCLGPKPGPDAGP